MKFFAESSEEVNSKTFIVYIMDSCISFMIDLMIFDLEAPNMWEVQRSDFIKVIFSYYLNH
jgi:hypothetical protein